MHFGNSAGNFGGSAVRQPVGHDSAAAMSKLVALLPNYMQIVQNWSEKRCIIQQCIIKEDWLFYYQIPSVPELTPELHNQHRTPGKRYINSRSLTRGPIPRCYV